MGFLAKADRLLHFLFTGGFAFLAGYSVERDKKIRKQSEKDRYLSGLGQAAATIVLPFRKGNPRLVEIRNKTYGCRRS